MTTQVYQLGGLGQTTAFPFAIQSPRSPITGTDVYAPNGTPYAVGQCWQNTTTNVVYQFIGAATWVEIGGGTGGPIDTLTGGTGGTISPTAGNINLSGTANQITTTGSGSTITWSLPSAITTPGSLTTTTTLTATSGAITATNGNLVLGTAGNKLSIATGANASVGTSAALSSGTITISTTAVTASSIILVSRNTAGGTLGNLSAPSGSIIAGTSFVINSSSSSDTSTVNWMIIN